MEATLNKNENYTWKFVKNLEISWNFVIMEKWEPCNLLHLGPPPQVPHPTPSGLDVGQLSTTLASGLCMGTLKMNTFSGDITPGKTKVSFEQWNHKAQCIKDHHPQSVVQESIMRSLKGAAGDMAWYMGPTASISDILDKLAVIFRTMALFDVLM